MFLLANAAFKDGVDLVKDEEEELLSGNLAKALERSFLYHISKEGIKLTAVEHNDCKKHCALARRSKSQE